jgi:CheY-like chemotaxis protein
LNQVNCRDFCQLVLVRVADDLRHTGQGGEFFRRALRVAAGHDDAGLRILPVYPADGGAGILIGRGRDRAGVQHDNFGFPQFGGAIESPLLELPLNGSAVGLGRATTKILYVKTCHDTIVAAQPDFEDIWDESCAAPNLIRKISCQPRGLDSFPEGQSMSRVLLVDDDQPVLLTLKAVLELNGFQVDIAASVAQAREKLKVGEYDAVITDVRMETEDAGYEVLRLARAQRNRPATAILTAYPPSDESWRKESVESLLVKPIGTRQLVQQLETLLARRAGTRLPQRGETAS